MHFVCERCKPPSLSELVTTKTFLQTRGKQWRTMNIASIIEDCEMHFRMAGESFVWTSCTLKLCMWSFTDCANFTPTSFKLERLWKSFTWDPCNWFLVGFNWIVICPYLCLYLHKSVFVFARVGFFFFCKSRRLCICKSRRLCICKTRRLRNQRGRASRS